MASLLNFILTVFYVHFYPTGKKTKLKKKKTNEEETVKIVHIQTCPHHLARLQVIFGTLQSHFISNVVRQSEAIWGNVETIKEKCLAHSQLLIVLLCW